MFKIRDYVWNSLRNYRSIQTGWLRLFSGTHRKKLPNTVFSYNKPSFFHFARRSLENIFLLWIFRKQVFTITYLQHCPFFYILPELEVSRCIPYLHHVLDCFVSVVLTFSIYKCCFDLQHRRVSYFWNRFKKREFLIKVQINIQHPWKHQWTNLHLILLKLGTHWSFKWVLQVLFGLKPQWMDSRF